MVIERQRALNFYYKQHFGVTNDYLCKNKCVNCAEMIVKCLNLDLDCRKIWDIWWNLISSGKMAVRYRFWVPYVFINNGPKPIVPYPMNRSIFQGWISSNLYVKIICPSGK